MIREYIVKISDEIMEEEIADRPQELVRCKDCIHHRDYGLTEDVVSECTIDHCENPDEKWFCADGKRREDDDDAEGLY